MSSDEEEPKDPATLYGIRTNAKRHHTRLANGLMALMDGEKGTEKVSVALAVLQEAYDEVVRVNARYMEVVKDKAQEAEAWEEEIATRYQGCRESAENYLKRTKIQTKIIQPRKEGDWNWNMNDSKRRSQSNADWRIIMYLTNKSSKTVLWKWNYNANWRI